MKNKFITIPIVPIIIFSIIILIVIIGKNVGKKEDEKIDEIVSQNILFEVSNATARAGEEITINIKMKKDSNFVAGNFELLYDNSQMKLIKYVKGEILEKGAMAIVNDDESENKILIGYVGDPQSENPIVEDGELISLTFKITENIKETQIKPEFKCTTLKEKDGEDIPYTIKQGNITIKNK